MPSAGLAGLDQAGQQHRVAQPHMASMWIGIRAAVGDMCQVQHMTCACTKRGRICLAVWNVG